MMPVLVFDVAILDDSNDSFANASDVVCLWDGAVACMFLHGLRFCGAYCFLKKDDFCVFDDGVSCCLGVLCTYFYLLVKIFGREGLLYAFIVVTLLENNMAFVGPINYYL